MTKVFFFFLIFLFPVFLFSQNLNYLMDKGQAALLEERYDVAREYFEQALALDPDSVEIRQFLDMAERLIYMEETDSTKEADRFIIEAAQLKENEDEEGDEDISDQLQDDFIYQQEQKDKARQQRNPLFFSLSFPVIHSYRQDVENISEDEVSLNTGYNLEFAFYPKRTKYIFGLGLEADQLYDVAESHQYSDTSIFLHFYFRNYLIEEVGARLVLGSRVGAGLSMLNGFPGGYTVVPSWQVSLFVSDPLLYHLTGSNDFKPLVFSLNASILYGEYLNIIDGDLTGVYRFSRFDIGLRYRYVYHFQYQNTIITPWNFSILLGLNL